jgi:uncharacterized protein (TIGR04255 family)
MKEAREFGFDSPEEWDWTIPGRLYERIKDEFPHRQQQNFVTMEVTQTSTGLTPNAQTGVDRLQFFRTDRSALVQVGPRLLSVNHLLPYGGWPSFKPLIAKVLDSYWEAAQPTGIRHIALRFINRIQLPPQYLKFEEYLHVYPNVPGGSDQMWQNWAQQVEIVRDELQALLVVQAGTQIKPSAHDTTKAQYAVMLDFVFVREAEEPLPRAAVPDWLETAHDEIEKMFFQSITPKCLELFEPQESAGESP